MIPIEDIKKIAAGEEVTFLVKPDPPEHVIKRVTALAEVAHGNYWMRCEESSGRLGRWGIIQIAEFSWRRKVQLMVVGRGYSHPAAELDGKKIELIHIPEPPQ